MPYMSPRSQIEVQACLDGCVHPSSARAAAPHLQSASASKHAFDQQLRQAQQEAIQLRSDYEKVVVLAHPPHAHVQSQGQL